VNDELKRTWKKGTVAYFMIIFQSLPGQTEEKQENSCLDTQCPGRNLNLRLSEYKLEVLTTQQHGGCRRRVLQIVRRT
jgi:hypothetical protein